MAADFQPNGEEDSLFIIGIQFICQCFIITTVIFFFDSNCDTKISQRKTRDVSIPCILQNSTPPQEIRPTCATRVGASALPSFSNGSRGRDSAIIDKIYESSVFPIANKIKKKQNAK